MIEPNLERFAIAQDPLIAQVERELAAGHKVTHWMWFVFPQLQGLGHSATAQRYAITSLVEAKAYFAHPLLGPRLVRCTALVNAVQGRSANAIFGTPDDLKFCSSMTLFRAAAPEEAAFDAALVKYFGGAADPRTLALLAAAR